MHTASCEIAVAMLLEITRVVSSRPVAMLLEITRVVRTHDVITIEPLRQQDMFS